jgi:hypothetical protein
MIKTYPGTSDMYRENMNAETIGSVVIRNYEKRGSRWSEIDSMTEEVTPAYYCNTVDAVPFFRNLGGSERVTMNYTKRGYIPVEISSISPDRQKKSVRRFYF